MTFENLLKLNYIQDLVRAVCGDETEIIERPAAHFIRNVNEGDRKVERLIFLPPHGYTANTPEQMNSHDEAESATIEIKGAIKADKSSFSIQKNCVFVASIDKNNMVSDLSEPYLTYDISLDEPHVQKTLHSAGTAPFYVVRSNGFGFYHNIVNVTDDWLVLKLVKTLRPQKHVDLQPIIMGMNAKHAIFFNRFLESVQLHGDEIFVKDAARVAQLTTIPLDISLPALGEMLYVHDTGKHEACTVFANILRLGKAQPEVVTAYLEKARGENQIPGYYAGQLIEKIRQHQKKVEKSLEKVG